MTDNNISDSSPCTQSSLSTHGCPPVTSGNSHPLTESPGQSLSLICAHCSLRVSVACSVCVSVSCSVCVSDCVPRPGQTDKLKWCPKLWPARRACPAARREGGQWCSHGDTPPHVPASHQVNVNSPGCAWSPLRGLQCSHQSWTGAVQQSSPGSMLG